LLLITLYAAGIWFSYSYWGRRAALAALMLSVSIFQARMVLIYLGILAPPFVLSLEFARKSAGYAINSMVYAILVASLSGWDIVIGVLVFWWLRWIVLRSWAIHVWALFTNTIPEPSSLSLRDFAYSAIGGAAAMAVCFGLGFLMVGILGPPPSGYVGVGLSKWDLPGTILGAIVFWFIAFRLPVRRKA
jgi:hypothetical protein